MYVSIRRKRVQQACFRKPLQKLTYCCTITTKCCTPLLHTAYKLALLTLYRTLLQTTHTHKHALQVVLHAACWAGAELTSRGVQWHVCAQHSGCSATTEVHLLVLEWLLSGWLLSSTLLLCAFRLRQGQFAELQLVLRVSLLKSCSIRQSSEHEQQSVSICTHTA
jgi:hypothetical protein